MDDAAELQAARRRGLGNFAAWPDELVCYLLHSSSLDERDVLRISLTSKLFRLLICEEPLWLQRHLERCARPFAFRVSLEW